MAEVFAYSQDVPLDAERIFARLALHFLHGLHDLLGVVQQDERAAVSVAPRASRYSSGVAIMLSSLVMRLLATAEVHRQLIECQFQVGIPVWDGNATPCIW